MWESQELQDVWYKCIKVNAWVDEGGGRMANVETGGEIRVPIMTTTCKVD
jgi:hypothetical protein